MHQMHSRNMLLLDRTSEPCRVSFDAPHQKLQPGHETVSTYSLPHVHIRMGQDRAQAHTQQQTLVITRCRPIGAAGTGLQQMRVSSCTSDAGTCAGSGLEWGWVTAAPHLLQCCTDAADSLHSGSRSCNHTDHRRRNARGTGRHVAARAEPAKHEDQSTSRDDEDLLAPFVSVGMPTSASYFTMTIIRHARTAHSNSECTVRQVHGATHDRLGIEAVITR